MFPYKWDSHSGSHKEVLASLLYIHSESNCTVVEGVFPLHLCEGL